VIPPMEDARHHVLTIADRVLIGQPGFSGAIAVHRLISIGWRPSLAPILTTTSTVKDWISKWPSTHCLLN